MDEVKCPRCGGGVDLIETDDTAAEIWECFLCWYILRISHDFSLDIEVDLEGVLRTKDTSA